MEQKLAETIEIDGHNVLMNGEEFPFVVGPEIRVEEWPLAKDADGTDAPFAMVTLTFWTDSFTVKRLGEGMTLHHKVQG